MAKIRLMYDSEWNELVKTNYNKDYYSIQQQNGCYSNGDSIDVFVPDTVDPREFNGYGNRKYDENGKQIENTDFPDQIPFEYNGKEGVAFKTWLETTTEDVYKEQPEWKEHQMELFWERNFYPHVQFLANDLYEKGVLKKGHYIIRIDW